MNLLTPPTFRPNAKAIPRQEHPDQQLRINRRVARVAVELCQILADVVQIDKPIYQTQQVILRNMVFKEDS